MFKKRSQKTRSKTAARIGNNYKDDMAAQEPAQGGCGAVTSPQVTKAPAAKRNYNASSARPRKYTLEELRNMYIVPNGGYQEAVPTACEEVIDVPMQSDDGPPSARESERSLAALEEFDGYLELEHGRETLDKLRTASMQAAIEDFESDEERAWENRLLSRVNQNIQGGFQRPMPTVAQVTARLEKKLGDLRAHAAQLSDEIGAINSEILKIGDSPG